MTAYAYLRKSVVSRERPGDTSREVQEDAIKALAARHGDEPVMLMDWGISGRKGADKRPGYKRLWEAIESGDCTAIYSYSLSRLARSVPELHRLFTVCAKRRIPIRLQADAVDTSTASGRLVATVLSALAEFEAEVAGERITGMYDARRANGEKVSNTPLYGDKGDEDLDAVLAAFDDAGSFMGAARLLNERGVPTRLGGQWIAASVSVIVRRCRPYTPHAGRGRRTIGAFRLARLLRCPCGLFLTGSTDKRSGIIRYQCRMGSMTPHQQRSITEKRLLPALRGEVARLRTPDRVRAMAADEVEQQALNAERERVLDLYQSGLLERGAMVSRLAAIDGRNAIIASRQVVIDVPRVDLDWEPADVNAALRSMWSEVVLDDDLLPVKVEWLPGLADWVS